MTLAIAIPLFVCLLAACLAWRRSDRLAAALRRDLDAKEAESREMAARNAADAVRIESLQAAIAADADKLTKMQDAFRAEFRVLANSIFDEKSTQFKQANKESLEMMLKPFRENISDFKQRVEHIYAAENTQRGELKAEIKNLLDQTSRISAETNSLTRALRGDSKTQGDFGEMLLETILSSAGLIRGEQYVVQENLTDEAGNNLRPDVIVNLPDGKRIIVDSKVALTAFVNYYNCEGEEQRLRHRDDHVKSVRNHLRGLSAKGYQDVELHSPDFVVMFIPNEPAFLAAVNWDSALLSDAYAAKVIVAGPTSLFPILKIVHDMWKRDDQTRNAREIAQAGANLYDKLIGLAETLADVGKGLEATQKNYEKAVSQLKTGKGNLISRTENLRKLGVKSGKSLPQIVADFESGEE